jgi:hypothetical protein
MLGEQHPEPFLNTPRGADLLRRVAAVQGGAQPSPLLSGQVLGTGQQHLSVDPDRVGDGAAAAQQLAGDALPDFGHHLVGECDQMPLVDRDPHTWEGGPHTGRVRCRRVDDDDLDRGPERLGLLGQPLLDAAAGAAGSQPQQGSRPVPGAVDERGQPRIGPFPAGLVEDPADRPGPGLINPQHRRRCRCRHPACRCGDQSPVRGRPRHAVLAGHFRHRPISCRDRCCHMFLQPLRHPRPGSDRHAGLGERPLCTQRLGTDQSAFPPPQLYLLPGGRQILDLHHRPVLHPAGEHPTRRARPLSSKGFDDDLDLPRGQPVHTDHPKLILDPEQD